MSSSSVWPARRRAGSAHLIAASHQGQRAARAVHERRERGRVGAAEHGLLVAGQRQLLLPGALADGRLVDQALLDQTEPFVFAIESADAGTLSVTAERTGSEAWSGLLDIDESGAVGGSTQHEDGTVVSPAP